MVATMKTNQRLNEIAERLKKELDFNHDPKRKTAD